MEGFAVASSPSLRELLDLLGGKGLDDFVIFFAGLTEDVFVVHCVAFIVYGLVAVDWLAVVEFIVEAVKLVVFVPPALVDNYDITLHVPRDTPRIQKNHQVCANCSTCSAVNVLDGL